MMNCFEHDFIQTNYYGKIKCEPSWVWRKREQALENYDLFYVWDGEGQVEVADRRYAVSKGACLLFRPGDRPSATHSPQRPLTLTYIHFNVKQAPASVPERYRRFVDPLELEAILSRYIRLRLEPEWETEAETRLMLRQLMIILLRSDRKAQHRRHAGTIGLQTTIRETANYIREHPAERLSVAKLAARAGLSEKYFAKKFASIIGEPVQAFAIRSRVERAEYLLRFGGMQVSEVADALGYRDVFFFSRQFKQYTGRNPSELR